MSIIKTIEARKSVRSFTGEPLNTADTDAVKKYISSLKAPFGVKARIQLVSTDAGGDPVRLGTYGVISKATEFLVLIYENGPLAEQGAGYMFEQAVLFCTGRGLGTCWLGGTLKHKDFISAVNLKENEVLRIVSPVGYPAAKEKLVEKVMRAGAGSKSRKPFGSLFFDGDIGTPLQDNNAGVYRQALEAVRLAPSASNTQPWRAVLKKDAVHFYYRNASKFSGIDAGIALCHFESACRELDVPGGFKVLDTPDIPVPASDKEQYVISWVG